MEKKRKHIENNSNSEDEFINEEQKRVDNELFDDFYLTDELILRIFLYVSNDFITLKSLRLTCKRFYVFVMEFWNQFLPLNKVQDYIFFWGKQNIQVYCNSITIYSKRQPQQNNDDNANNLSLDYKLLGLENLPLTRLTVLGDFENFDFSQHLPKTLNVLYVENKNVGKLNKFIISNFDSISTNIKIGVITNESKTLEQNVENIFFFKTPCRYYDLFNYFIFKFEDLILDNLFFFLTSKGHSINQKNVFKKGCTPLFHYITSCNDLQPEKCFKIVKSFLENNASTNETNNDGKTPLHEIYPLKTVDIAKLLIDYGAKLLPDNVGMTPFHYSVYHCNFNLMKLLYEKFKPMIDMKDGLGRTPLMLSFLEASIFSYDKTNVDNIKLFLLNHGANVDIFDKNNWTSLHYAVFNEHDPEIVAMIIQKTSDINKQTILGETSLYMACQKNIHYNNKINDLIEILLINGADPNITDFGGKTCFQGCVSNNNFDGIQLLKKYGLTN